MTTRRFCMIYKLEFDMDRIDNAIKKGTNTIYAHESNLLEIEYEGIKKGYFMYIITKGKTINNWPKIQFYYSSIASTLENEYLLNVDTWPIIHVSVKEEFEKNGIEGIQYLPIELIDTFTRKTNRNYVVMNVLNLLDVIDMEKSEFIYTKEYNLYTFMPHATYFKQNSCDGYDIFRANKNAIPLYVSEKLKKIIENSDWIGFDLYSQRMSK